MSKHNDYHDNNTQETAASKRRDELDDLLSTTFNAVLRIEERSLDNKITKGLTITEVHTIVAVGLHESNPMNIIAGRLGITLATLTTAVNKLVDKGFLQRKRCTQDRRRMLLSLTSKGRQVYRVHNLFHKKMLDEALGELTEEEEMIFASSLMKVKEFLESHAEGNLR